MRRPDGSMADDLHSVHMAPATVSAEGSDNGRPPRNAYPGPSPFCNISV